MASGSSSSSQSEELTRNVQKEIEEKSCSDPPSPSKVLGVGKNSAPSSPRSGARTPREQNTVSDVAGTPETVPGVAVTDETRSEQQPAAHTRSESAAVIQEAAAADAQGEAAFAEMEQAMTGLLDPSHKKVEPPKLPRDFATKCPSSDADQLHGGVMDDPVISSSGYFTESSDYQVENDSMLDKMMIMGGAGVDPKEELFHRIKSLKDGYLYKLMELDRQYTVPNLTKEQLHSSDKTEDFNNRVRTKESIREALKFLQDEKNHVYDGLMEKLPTYEALILSLMSVLEELEVPDVLMNAASYSGGKKPQQQQAQPADASPSFPINSPEGQVQREGAETLVANNPSDRLLYAASLEVLSSESQESDSVPLGAFPDWTSLQQLGGSSNMNKLKRVFDHSSHTQSPLFGSMDDCGMPFEGDASDSEFSGLKRQKMQNANYSAIEEIKAINRTLIDTKITIAGDRITSSSDAGTTIKLSYTAVALSPDLKLLFASSEKIMPAKLSVPSDYPRRSPMLITDEGDDQLRKKSSTISDSVHAAFPLALKDLPEPHSIKDIATAWDTCVRTAITKFAQQYGGGTFSSRFGPWERCDGS